MKILKFFDSNFWKRGTLGQEAWKAPSTSVKMKSWNTWCIELQTWCTEFPPDWTRAKSYSFWNLMRMEGREKLIIFCKFSVMMKTKSCVTSFWCEGKLEFVCHWHSQLQRRLGGGHFRSNWTSWREQEITTHLNWSVFRAKKMTTPSLREFSEIFLVMCRAFVD